MPPRSGKTKSAVKTKHRALIDEIDPSFSLENVKGRTVPTQEQDDESEVEPSVVTGRMSKKVLKAVKEQRQEIIREESTVVDQEAAEQGRRKLEDLTANDLLSGSYGDSDDDNDTTGRDFDDDDDDGIGDDEHENDMLNLQDDEFIQLTEEDRQALEMFMPSIMQPRETLADSIFKQMKERENNAKLGLGLATKEGQQELRPGVPREVIAVYQKIGQFLKKYKSGKLPKAFKIIPTLRNWEEVMYYTTPNDWSPAATHAAVRLFVTVLNPRNAQRFFSLVLVPKIQAAVEKEGRLAFHLYDSLKRAIYKPTAFFKGIILPMAANGCSSREAVVYASVLNRVHIPAMHAAVTLLQLSKLEFSSVQCLFLRVLINKKFSLPLPVVDALSKFFYDSACQAKSLPVLWHRALLSFVERYKYSLTDDNIAMIKAAIKKKHHKLISDEIRRELAATTSLSGAAQAASASSEVAMMD